VAHSHWLFLPKQEQIREQWMRLGRARIQRRPTDARPKEKTTACLIPNDLRAGTRHIVFKLVVLVV
jgi:hypothetical protein